MKIPKGVTAKGRQVVRFERVDAASGDVGAAAFLRRRRFVDRRGAQPVRWDARRLDGRGGRANHRPLRGALDEARKLRRAVVRVGALGHVRLVGGERDAGTIVVVKQEQDASKHKGKKTVTQDKVMSAVMKQEERELGL